MLIAIVGIICNCMISILCMATLKFFLGHNACSVCKITPDSSNDLEQKFWISDILGSFWRISIMLNSNCSQDCLHYIDCTREPNIRSRYMLLKCQLFQLTQIVQRSAGSIYIYISYMSTEKWYMAFGKVDKLQSIVQPRILNIVVSTTKTYSHPLFGKGILKKHCPTLSLTLCLSWPSTVLILGHQ